MDDFAYRDALADNPDLAIMVKHPNDRRCPGHDINLVLIEASRRAGFCLCIHPFMGVIDFFPMTCAWSGQPIRKDAVSPEMKAIRTAAVTEGIGGQCPDAGS